MKNLPPKKKYLKTLLFSVNILLLITCTDLFAAPTVHQDFSEEMLSCYTPKGGIVNGCGSNVFLSNGLPNSEDSEVEQIYRLDGFSNTASLHVCKTNLLGDKGITFYSYDSLLTKDLLSTLVYASEGESVSQTNPVRENDLATTPTICTRKDNVVDDTFYMTVFPPMLRLDPILKSVGSYEPANTTIPTTPVEVVCQGSDSYAECQVKALSAYSKSYESNAVPLLVSTIPSDNDKAVDPKLTKLTMVFNESIGPDIFPASGYLKQLSDDSIIETFSASDDKVTIDSTGTILTITLSNSLLLPESDYYIQVEMGLVASQTTNNLYSGITFNDTWNFTTNGYPLLAGVSIKGVAAVSSKLTAVPGAFSDPDIGDTAGVYGYQWYRGTDKNCDLNSTPITDAITSSYTPIGTDVDNLLCVAVTPKDNHGLLGVPVFSEAILKTIKATQKITFTDTSNVLYTPNLTFTTSATSGSGLVVTVAVDPESDSFGVCTISGSTVTVNFAGNCDLVASQTGDEKYAPAKLAFQTVVISKAPQEVSFEDPTDLTYRIGLNFKASMSSTSGLATVLSSTSLSVCTVSDNTVRVLSGGSCDLIASQPGNINYKAAVPVSRTVLVFRSSQEITFNDPAGYIGVAGGSFNAPASVNSSLSVKLSSSTPSVCTVIGQTVTVVESGICELVASQAGNASYLGTAINRSVIISTIADVSGVTVTGGGGGFSTIELLLLSSLVLLYFYRHRIFFGKRGN